jgi:hypothetical protein
METLLMLLLLSLASRDSSHALKELLIYIHQNKVQDVRIATTVVGNFGFSLGVQGNSGVKVPPELQIPQPLL